MRKMRKWIAAAVIVFVLSPAINVFSSWTEQTEAVYVNDNPESIQETRNDTSESEEPEVVSSSEPTATEINPEEPEEPVSESPISEENKKTYEDLWDESNEAYIIATAEDLKVFRNSLLDQVDYSDKTVYLIRDIVLDKNADVGSAGNLDSEENTGFQGTFDGRGHFIEGWSKPDEGLFSIIGEKGNVCNLYMKEVNIEDALLGTSLCYMNCGNISCCSVSGTISGEENYYAGIAYCNLGKISNCLSKVNINTTKSKPTIAGVVCSNIGSITNCVYLGTLSTTQKKKINLFGIADENVTNCYYLQQDNYKTVGIPCTEEDLKIQSTYLEFDFEHIWAIHPDQNEGYPMLRMDFPELKIVTKVPVSIEVKIGDYKFDSTSRMKGCFFPLSVQMEYAGNNDKVKQAFPDLLTQYHVSADLITDKWRKDFLVDIPVNGVSRDFSKTNPEDYFNFSYARNEECEFYIADWHYANVSATYYDSTTCNNKLTTEEKNEIIRKAQEAAEHILDCVYQKYGREAMDNTWFAFTAARAGYYPAGTNKDEMFERISNVWKEYKDYQKSVGKKPETTETARFVLAVTAMGFDPTDVAGSNLIKELIASDNNGKYFAQHYLAYALYSGRYADYMPYVKGLVKEQINTSKKNSYSADDMAIMYMQPVFLMYGKNDSSGSSDSYAVKEYVENELIPWMQRSITGFGTFYSPYTHCNNNVWTDAQAQMLLALLDVDFLSEGYVKNGNTILDYIIKNPETSLDYKGDESQCARAIVSLVRCYRGETNLFDCSDVIGVRQIEAKIAELPAVIRESDADLVNEVQSAFLKLTAGQRNQVDNKSVLERAIATLEQFQLDKEIARKIEMRIASIGKVTLEKQALITQLRKDYDQLTPEQRERVSNYQVLLDAETQLQKLLEADNKKTKKKNDEKPSKNKKKKRNNEHDSKNETESGDAPVNKVYTGSDDEVQGQTEDGAVTKKEKTYAETVEHEKQQSSIGGEGKKIGLKKIEAKSATKSVKKKSILLGKPKETSNKKMANKVLGESSLVLNKTLSEQKSFFSTSTFWCYVSAGGAGLFVLSIGVRMGEKKGKVKEEEQCHEKENS